MLASQMSILRVFGLPEAEISAVVRAAEAEGCPGLRLLERDGEFAVCLQVSAPTQAMADEYCEKWTQKLRARLGDAVYGTGEASLARATLEALLKKRRLLVAADETTGRLLGALLQPLEHSEAAYDFGTHTWADAAMARKLVTPPAILQKFPGDVLQAAAARAALSLGAAEADYAVVYMPATVGQAPFVLLCDKRGALAAAVGPDLPDAAIANHLLDLVRRRTLGLHPSAGTISFRPGHEHPLLIVSQDGQPGQAVRSTRRRPVRQPAAPAVDGQPTGTITFESEDAPPPAPPAPRPAEEEDRADTVTFDPLPKLTGPLDFETAGPAAAAASRAARGQPAAGEEEPPAHSLLDDDIPDFSAGLDPAAIEAARKADEDAPPASAEDFQQAASKLFEPPETEEPDDAPPARDPMAVRRAERDAVARKNRSLAVIRRSARRRRRHAILATVAAVAVLGAGGFAAWYFLHNDLGARPAPRSYGTEAFDTTAGRYLRNAMERLEGIEGYLAFPGLEGRFLTAAGAQTPEGQQAGVCWASENWLGSATPSNTTIDCGDALQSLADEAAMAENTGFTLYLPGTTYRCKVVAVYYAEADGFHPAAYTDLSDYYTYLDFVLGIGTRSLYDTGATAGEDDHFLTLVGQSDTDGVQLCITGRLLTETESQTLATSISTNESALLTGAQYQASGRAAPDPGPLLAAQLDRYTAAGAAAAAEQSDSQTGGATGGTTGLEDDLAALQQETDALIASTKDMMAGLSDIAGQIGAVETDLNQGAEGSVPSQTVPVDSLISTAPTSAPTAAPTEPPASSQEGQGDQTPAAEPTEQPAPTEAPASETISVTMNGTAQDMDLVTCLAMIAQNELGANAPAEAYKAQCVAAHCWILSQGGYPSVAGTTPGEAALAAAREVAHVLVTYNGQVCFTPYFASASTGTASAADVWGSAIPYLVAVDSPYDQSVASNWNTNGYNTGCARFSRQTLQDRILEMMGVDLSGVDPNSWFTILSTNEYGWVAQMQIGPNASGNDTCSGRWFRETLTAGCSVDGRSLRSQCFTVSYDADLDCFIFDVKGYGHGCGMSQWGAIGYARNGWSYQDILTHYYPGTTLTSY